MNKKMTRWGCGPNIIIKTLLVAVFIYLLQYFFFPFFKFNFSQETIFVISGIWVFLGFLIWIRAALDINKNLPKGNLITCGVFKYVQHPLYSVFIFFYIPSLVLISKSIIGFILPFVFYYFFKKQIGFEERYLGKKFGREYLDYKKRTGVIFPNFLYKKK